MTHENTPPNTETLTDTYPEENSMLARYMANQRVAEAERAVEKQRREEKREIIDGLATDLRDTLHLSMPADDISTLANQMHIMDKIFRRLCIDADLPFDLPKFATALKAQNQYRQTLATLNDTKIKMAQEDRRATRHLDHKEKHRNF